MHRRHVLATLLLLPAAAGAAQIDLSPRTLRWQYALDYYTADGAADALAGPIRQGEAEQRQNGSTGIATSRTGSGGIGARVGFLVDPQDPLGRTFSSEPSPYQAGLTFSAVAGPRFGATQTFTDPVNGPGSNHYDSRSYFLRLLLEGQARGDLGASGLRGMAGAAIGYGLGLSFGHNEAKGAAVQPGIPSTNSLKDHSILPTWELSAAVSYPAAGAEFQLGLRYAAFPRTPHRNRKSELLPVDWKPFGLFLALVY